MPIWHTYTYINNIIYNIIFILYLYNTSWGTRRCSGNSHLPQSPGVFTTVAYTICVIFSKSLRPSERDPWGTRRCSGDSHLPWSPCVQILCMQSYLAGEFAADNNSNAVIFDRWGRCYKRRLFTTVAYLTPWCSMLGGESTSYLRF